MQTNTVTRDLAVSGDARIAVIGIGGAGCRIASKLYGRMGRVGVIAINTDRAALEQTAADTRLYICKEVTKGLGTNGDPALGKKCAQIHDAEISAAVSKYQYAFIIAGLGGGTGSGAASVVAELCDRAGVKVGAVAIMPFGFETGRAVKAAEGYRALHAVCPDIVRCENDKVLSIPGLKSLDDAMMTMNDMVVDKILETIDEAKELIKKDIVEHSENVTETSKIVDKTVRASVGLQKSH